jgi:hypothetical protein|tara:strand:- start:220 stop:399 length:180 start_codon:yes stop_codon:yes gene_type:complete
MKLTNDELIYLTGLLDDQLQETSKGDWWATASDHAKIHGIQHKLYSLIETQLEKDSING